MNQRNLHPSPHRWSIPSVLFRSLVVAACFVQFPGTRAIAQSVNLGDCDSAAFVCSDTLILGTSMSTGAVNDLLENCGCLCGGERSSAWIQINIATSGTLGLLLTPDQNNTDLDFAVWGPYTEFLCPQPVDPIRCSFASRLSQVSSNVGLVPFESDTSELANSGNGLVAAIAVNAGELYVLYINNFSMDGDAVAIAWNLTNGATLSCTRPISTGLATAYAADPLLVRVREKVIDVSVEMGEFDAYLVDALGRQVMHKHAKASGSFDITSVAPGRYAVVVVPRGRDRMRTVSVVIP